MRMKKVINFCGWVVLLSLCVGLSSCSKKDDNNGDPFYIKAKINGQSYYTADVGASSNEYTASVSQMSFDGNEPFIMISFPAEITVGTYNLSDDVFGDCQSYYQDGSGYYPINNGSITITEYDKTKGLIKGTFQFTVGGFTITDGEFSAQLPSSYPLPD